MLQAGEGKSCVLIDINVHPSFRNRFRNVVEINRNISEICGFQAITVDLATYYDSTTNSTTHFFSYPREQTSFKVIRRDILININSEELTV